VLYWRSGVAATVTVTATLAVITLIYAAVLHLTDIEDSVYYRPDEMLSEIRYDYGHRAYLPNSSIHMHMPHGDLQPMTGEAIAVPRDVDYRIDGYGFRNDRDYDGERYVLVGDSFVNGTGNTQSDLLSRQLKDRYGIATYNLAHPGGLPEYAAYVSAFHRRHQGFRVLLFVFEGNDFIESGEEGDTMPTGYWRRYQRIFANVPMHRFTKSLIKRATRHAQISGSNFVIVRAVDGRGMAILNRYIEATRADTQSPLASFERALAELRPDIAQVYFIPTNYRIYYERIEHRPASTLANAKWDYLNVLCKREGLACTNLTEPMRRAADRLWPRGELLWWADDTHWNRQGIAVAAEAVSDTLHKSAAHGAGQ
jgi:hypothetical protein